MRIKAYVPGTKVLPAVPEGHFPQETHNPPKTFVDFQFLPCLNATFFIEILRDNHVGEPNLLFKRQVVFPRDTEMMRWHARDAAMLFLLLSIDSR